MKKKKTFIIITLLLVIAGGLTWWLWPNDSLKDYQPSQEFKPAFEALDKGTEDAEKYDIEETVRAMNSLEMAQYQSEDFLSYLEYVAKQDFSNVPQEVLDQKKKLFPILQRLFELKKQHEELDDVWMLMRSASSGASTFVDNVNPVMTLTAICSGDADAIGSLNLAESAESARLAAFEQYEKDKELKASLEKEIDEVRMEYIKYLEDYAPIYYKYMKEWDELCLSKDKAYIDLYCGRPIDAYNATNQILDKYPTNREALLLKSLSLINIASSYTMSVDAADNERQLLKLYKEMNMIDQQPQEINEFYVEAEQTLDQYTKLYPSKSAPALVLKGLLYHHIGEEGRAMSCFDQASIEYPRQAKELTDLLDSYRSRSYLNNSSEGKYLLRLYRSTMEGFGLFSPNLLKAKYYSQQGDFDKSKEEIFNHFFRRGNQGVYDCFLSDMQYCEENMYSSFKQILIEQSFLDVSITPTKNLGVIENDDEINVTINNRSDIDLENVRIFLCLHYTDMYKDEYDVQKVKPINIIKHNSTTDVGVVKLNYEDKKYDDITRVRAIAMTDDKICWIDNVDYKYMQASEKTAKAKKTKVSNEKMRLLQDFNVDAQSLAQTISAGIRVAAKVKDGKGDWLSDGMVMVNGMLGKKGSGIEIELPRILSLIDPVFSLNQVNDKDKSVRPKEDYLSGSNIRLKFDYDPKEGETIPLYIYSDFINFKATIKFTGGKPEVKNVEIV